MIRVPKIIVPDIDDPFVQKLRAIICPTSIPIYVNLELDNSAKANECFDAVSNKVIQNGGRSVYGWRIWKEEILIEAEFHTVWESEDQKTLIDITPKEINIENFTSILFLPDPNNKFTGKQIDSIRLNITSNRLVDDFIEISKGIFQIENKGDRAFQREVEFYGNEVQLHENLIDIRAKVYLMILEGKTRNSECFCGSGNKFKHCCEKLIFDQLHQI